MAFWKALSDCPRFTLTIRAAVSNLAHDKDTIMRESSCSKVLRWV
jgi:hypothetical protein